jgi:hypothetical protein
MQLMSARRMASGVAVAVAASITVMAAPAHASGTSAIAGAVWQDNNRNGVRDAGEQGFAGRQINIFDSTGAYVANGVTDANGNYSVGGLAAGAYTVAWDTTDWQSLRQDWVPTTTGSLAFELPVSLQSSARADFGLRQIVRSSDLSAPITTYKASSGLVIHSYNDAVSAQVIYDMLVGGSLVNGPDAGLTTIYFDFGTSTDCSVSVGGSPGSYVGYTASMWLAWLPWLDAPDHELFHEYGHAWGFYNEWMVQQEGDWSSYLKARGLAGDPRVSSSYVWDPREMIAEDYRELFGTPEAAAYPQMNTDIPPAASVPGLKDWLRSTFTTPPAGASGGGSANLSPTVAPVTVSAPSVTPTPVTSNATVGSTVSAASTVTLAIRTTGGSLVRMLLNTSTAGGTVAASWDRKNASGRRVKSGTYFAVVTAVEASGASATAKTSFTVS